MFATFRRHQKWIWIIAVIVVIPSFVIFLGPSTGNDRGAATASDSTPFTIDGKEVTIDGRPITFGEFRPAYQETRLALFIRSGEWPDAGERLDIETIKRIFLHEKMKQFNVEVSDKAAAEMARTRLGRYPYEQFKQDILARNNLAVNDFERYIHTEAGILQLVGVAALNSKLITTAEADFVYRQEHEEVDTQAAVFWRSNYIDQVPVTDELVAAHYTKSRGLYRIPTRVQVNYVEFPATNFLDQAAERLTQITNLTELIEREYLQRGVDTFKDTNGNVLDEAAAKAEIKDLYLNTFALNVAHQKAMDFGSQLYDHPARDTTNSFLQLAQQNSLEIKVSPPFDTLNGLEGLNLPEDFGRVGSRLTETNANAFQPIRGTNAVYVLSFRNKVPDRLPPLEEIRDKVLEDYKETEATLLAVSAGTNFYTFLTNGLAQNKTFDELAAEKNVTVEKIPPFSLSSTNLPGLDERLRLGQLRRLAFQGLEEGEVSNFLRTIEGGFIFQLIKRLPFDEAKVLAGLPDTIDRLRQMRQSEAFNQWFTKQAQASLVIPEPAPPPPSPGGLPPGTFPPQS